MTMNSTLGTSLFISPAPFTGSETYIAAYTLLGWIEVGQIENLGEFGQVFELVTFQNVKDGRKQKLKGGFDAGQMQLTLGEDLTDSGQLELSVAAEDASQNVYGFKITLNDAGTRTGPSTFYFSARVMSFKTVLTTVTNVVKSTTMLEITSPVFTEGPAELLDTFPNAEDLSVYLALIGASTVTTVPPSISGNALVAVTGHDAAGTFAVNGAQLIHQTGFKPQTLPLTLEVKVKISDITNVYLFVGWMDESTTGEQPIVATTIPELFTATASNAIGFLWDTVMMTPTIQLVGIKNGSGAYGIESTKSFVNNTYRTLRLEMDMLANANFYIDGVLVGNPVPAAIGVANSMFATICVSSHNNSAKTITVQRIYLEQ